MTELGSAESDGRTVLGSQSALRRGGALEWRVERGGGSCETSMRVFQAEGNHVQSFSKQN